MKRTLILLCWAGLFGACREPKVAKPACQPVMAIKGDSDCASIQPMLTITALKYKLPPDTQFEWAVYVFEDVASVNIIDKYKWTGLTGKDKLTVPDSVLKDYAVVVVKVNTICEDKRLESPGFRLIKEKAPQSNCVIWRDLPF